MRLITLMQNALKKNSFRLGAPPNELRLDVTLNCGMSFLWQRSDDKTWRGIIANSDIQLEQTPDDIICTLNYGDASINDVRSYFQLDTPLQPLINQWIQADPRLTNIAKAFPGLRVLWMDPFECLISFICSSANNIARITSMVNRLRSEYGEPTPSGACLFPTAACIAERSADDLRKLGFGYRASYVVESARLIAGHADDWLVNQRLQPYETAHQALQTLPGIGAKVADCICLFALDKPGAIPVDTHVWQIARRDYGLFTDAKSLTPKVYKGIGDYFRNKFGSYAGWAHNLLFAADLPAFKHRLL